MFMLWTHLAFLHWPAPEAVLRPLIPDPLVLDTFEGTAWLGVVPFRMEQTRFRGLPPIPTARAFPEVNVRTYVRGAGRSGVWFFSLDAGSVLAVHGARLMYNLPYHHALMKVDVQEKRVRYESRRLEKRQNATLKATYEPIGDVYTASPGTLDHWLTERYCLFGRRRDGRVYYMDVHHQPWPLQPCAATITKNTLLAAAGLNISNQNPPQAHYAHVLDVQSSRPTLI